ncbi:sigma-70 family RNA polymerase sigma factor [Novosphingobium sp. G106]|uniref:RNA polymerase sigma factor n=1 Tax=Novosphingobium sp. G106 TaxID=2849500 RepID=UPI0028123A0B|nr:sigma-70 family RNA polymerase sigma factor [Novosphingobium sp. G106]
MQADSSRGLEAVYRLYHGELLRFLTARLGDVVEAEDILQELWIRLQNAPGSPVANGRAYLYRMAQNLIVDRIREKQRRMRRERLWLEARGEATISSEPADQARNAEEVLLEREETARLAATVAELPEGARRVFELHKQQGLSHAQVAMRLGISKSGVEKHMAVAMKYFRRALLD